MADVSFLESILPKDFSHKIVSFTPTTNSDAHFKAEIRANVKSRDEFDLWKTQFEQLSGTNYIVGHTNANPKRALFIREFVCRRSKKHKKDRDTDNRRKALILNDNCHSKFDVKIKLDTPNTREKDPLIREGFLTIVKITWCHSHTIANENVDSLYKLKTSPATEAAFYSYFEMGMSISEAKEYHKEVLQSQPDYDPGITLADVSQNPKERVIINLHSKWRTATQGAQRGASMIEKLRTTAEELRSQGIKVEYSESPFAIAIVTPIAERVHEEEMSKHVAFVDSSASCDLDNHSVTFLLTLSPAGALPLGLVITEKQSQKSYAKGFQLLKEIVGDDGFGGQGFPTVFMTDDSTAERSALKEVWPESQQKLCQFHASQAMWKWLWDGTHNIRQQDRQSLQELFRSIMYSNDEASATAAYELAMASVTAQKYKNFRDHLKSYWESIDTVTGEPKRKLWCTAYREGITLGNDTNNYSEACVRIFKDVILARYKAYNPVSLMRLVCTRLELYYRNRLLDFANDRKPAQFLLLESLKAKAAYLTDKNQIIQLSDTAFEVPSSKGTHSYTVNVERHSCSCPVGFSGGICKHKYAVGRFYNLTVIEAPKVRRIDHYRIALIALGEKAPKPEFYMVPPSELSELSEQRRKSLEIESMEAGEDEENQEESVFVPQFDPQEILKQREIFISTLSSAVENLPMDDPSAHTAIKKVTNVFKKSNPSQVISLLFAAASKGRYTHNAGKRIAVNETSRSRRKGSNRGARPVQKGRPPLNGGSGATHSGKGRFPAGVKHSGQLKRVRNLGKNISANRPNAKSHGTGH